MSLIALGVTGGIGAYKAVEVARGLQKRGHDVAAIMTRSARQFVGEVTFEAITRRRGHHRPVRAAARTPTSSTSRWRPSIGLLLVAPATANIIGKFANGIADDFLTLALPGDARAGADGAGDEHATCSSTTAVRRNLADAGRARRAVRRSRRRAISPAGGSARGASPSPTTSSTPRERHAAAVAASLLGRLRRS